MSRLFYTNTEIPTGLDAINRYFAIEAFVPGVGILVNATPLIVSSFFEPKVDSFEAFVELTELLAATAKVIAIETGNSITITVYSTKSEGLSGQLNIKPLIVVSTVSRGLGSLKVGEDTQIGAAVESGEFTLRRIRLMAGNKMKLIDGASAIYKAGRLALLPTTTECASDSILESCLGGVDFKPYQRCLMTKDLVGAVFVRQTLPQIIDNDLSEEIFAALVREPLTLGLGCRIDAYAVSTKIDHVMSPTCYVANTLEEDDVVESFASQYIHWEKKSEIDDHLGSFMEHLAIRAFELSAIKSLAKVSSSNWVPSFENNGVAFVGLFPGTVALLNTSLSDRHRRFFLT